MWWRWPMRWSRPSWTHWVLKVWWHPCIVAWRWPRWWPSLLVRWLWPSVPALGVKGTHNDGMIRCNHDMDRQYEKLATEKYVSKQKGNKTMLEFCCDCKDQNNFLQRISGFCHFVARINMDSCRIQLQYLDSYQSSNIPKY